MGIVFTIMIVQEVSKRGVKINWFLIRLFMIKYIDQYKSCMERDRKDRAPVLSLRWILCRRTLVFAIISDRPDKVSLS
jgi:hypothetical protein